MHIDPHFRRCVLTDTMASRLRSSFEQTLEELIAFIVTVPIKRNQRTAGDFVIVGPEYSFHDVSPEMRSVQISLKRRYNGFADLVGVLLGGAPEHLRDEWKRADSDIRDWIELQVDWGLDPHRQENERRLRTAAAGVEEILRVFDATGDKDDVFVVPDTSSLIEQPDPAKYREIAGRPGFTFVLLPSVLAELDELKIAHKNPDVREAAKSVIRRIRGWRDQVRQRGETLASGAKVDGTIIVRTQHIEPDMEASLPWLDAAVPDDRMVASVLALEAEHPSARIVLVTGDINLQNKSDAASIETANTP